MARMRVQRSIRFLCAVGVSDSALTHTDKEVHVENLWYYVSATSKATRAITASSYYSEDRGILLQRNTLVACVTSLDQGALLSPQNTSSKYQFKRDVWTPCHNVGANDPPGDSLYTCAAELAHTTVDKRR